MKAKEFNELTAKYVEEILKEKGFKKKGVHYYLYEAPKIMVFYKKTHRGAFEGFYIALIHDFHSNTKDENSKLKIPSYLENYPLSISTENLKSQYAKFTSAFDFDYDMNFVSRKILSSRASAKGNSIKTILKDTKTYKNKNSEEYIKFSLDVTLNEGFKLLNEFSSLLSYKTITKQGKIDQVYLDKLKTELEEDMTKNNINIPKDKTRWWEKIFGLKK